MSRIDGELIDAALENNLPEVSRLLIVGADVNAKDNYGNTPLHRAGNRGHVQVVKELMGHGADTETKNRFGWTALQLACWNGQLAVFFELLSPNDSNGATTSILDKRKSRGANIEATTVAGNTPLHFACLRDHLPIVKALLIGGANILAANDEGHLPIHAAVSRGRSAVAKYLLQHFYASIIRRLPLHELLEDITWIGNPKLKIGVTPLRAALRRNVLRMDDVVEILEYLVGRNPALLSARDQDGLLPLHVACRRGASFAIVQSLVNLYKASVMSVTPQGDLPLFLACEIPEPSLDTIFLLIRLYPDLVYRSLENHRYGDCSF
jgi:ankyrin repeat protein